MQFCLILSTKRIKSCVLLKSFKELEHSLSQILILGRLQKVNFVETLLKTNMLNYRNN